jgi:pimeloyl-ACP methyl ester carboxylesterase
MQLGKVTRMRRRLLIAGVTVVSAIATLVVNPAPAAAAPVRDDSKNETVIFVHGWNSNETTDCTATWAKATSLLRDRIDWTGTFVTWGYYSADRNCTAKYNGTQETSLDTLARSLATYIYDNYSSRGEPVDLVAHSMGGLIARRAVAGTQRQDSGFPAYLYVEDAVTLATPHLGTPLAVACRTLQCRQMESGSDFLDRIKVQAENPQSRFGTDWSTLGSEADVVVSESSAIGMSSGHKYTYLSNAGIDHTEMRTNDATPHTFDVKWWHASGPRSGTDLNAGPPLSVMANALHRWQAW